MRHFFVAVAALATSVVAQTAGFDPMYVPYVNQIVKVGQTLHIVWDPSTYSGTVRIELMKGGSPTTLQVDSVPLVQKLDNSQGYYGWEVPSSIAGYATYGIQITLDNTGNSTFQQSNPFKITQ
ncbi:Cell wall beta-glucan synthesis protein [Rutstroemia sp. NJR-2017a BVV2]|nr:Cell wall beta-glucan synthesis protein [Rutstroemia sp. NJR-2017a BVV2]PQE19700.1 Cell wall beta-glucan synthesis protein [Rutstroemia sp. NJR-2017a BVV2]